MRNAGRTLDEAIFFHRRPLVPDLDDPGPFQHVEEDADLLISADCVPIAYADFHAEFLSGRIVIVFSPKLDSDIDGYIEKRAAIFSHHAIRSITVAHLEVPCCSGVRYVVDRALEQSGKKIPVLETTITIEGGIA